MKAFFRAILVVVIIAGLAFVVWRNRWPQPTSASGRVWDGYTLYGVDPQSAALIRYEFSSSNLNTVGTVHTSSISRLAGIEGSAYFPGFQNIFGFWTDPSDDLTKLAYINIQTAEAVLIGNNLGRGRITGATAVAPPDAAGYTVYAVQVTEPISFAIDSGKVIPSQSFAAGVTVLGAAISAGGAYDMPVTLKVRVNSAEIAPFGLFTLPVDANVNDGHNPRPYALPSNYPAGSAISIVARSWLLNSGVTGTSNSDWHAHLTVDSLAGSPQVLTLRNGDPVPNIAPFLDQSSIAYYVRDYVDPLTNTIALEDNQAIYLFELGTADLTSSAADFQDLVVLVTLAEDLATLNSQMIAAQGTLSGSVHLNPNNAPNNEFTLIKPDGTVISRDDLLEGAPVTSTGAFYSGQASSVRFKVKGGGTQNGLLVNGQPYPLDNNVAYLFSSAGNPLTVTIRNTNPVNGKAMGQWWIDFVNQPIGSLGDGEDTIRLIRVDHQTGDTTQLMDLSRRYESLASTNGQTFYATSGGEVYRIDLQTHSETLVGTLTNNDLRSMGFAGTTLLGFDITSDRIVSINTSTGQQIETPLSVGARDLGTIVLTPTAKDPLASKAAYD